MYYDDELLLAATAQLRQQLVDRGLDPGLTTEELYQVIKRVFLDIVPGVGDPLWDVFVSSCEVGVRKPAPRIYQIALDELGIEPEEAAFVGHKASELQGAKAVGMTTVAFNLQRRC